MSRVEQIGAATLYHGDSRDVLKALPDNSIDSVVTDPPYALVSMVKRFGGENAAPAQGNDAYMRASAGFMGRQWDTGETAFAVAFWAEVMRVLKPGGHVIAASGTRTYHRLAVAIEDAGFEIRDMVSWLYGSGFPKSHNQGNGWGTALKPACEPWVLARKPLIGTVAANVLAHGTGALNIDECRVGDTGARNNGRTVDSDIYGKLGAFQRVEYNKGRWPANVIHDGSDEVVGAFPEAPGQQGVVTGNEKSSPFANVYGDMPNRNGRAEPRLDAGSAARFFYSAKADAMDRVGSKHPTVKPVDLMQYLCRLITPPGGVVLDPFAGSGTTGEAAWREGFRCVLIEREADYFEDIVRRMGLCEAGPATRRHAVTKARGKVEAPGGLFAGVAAA
ncbi:DNA-methyltransferase [Sphingomonas sp.]|uniref:DNA-methyltransferase n=1 Tax=Sphingomonas sp. TaxID=28214 RepID=UPI003BA90692